ncbi:MAG: prepilin-type N-terminal cleavage/methylation domain-containing protein [Thermodesulfobacteriota bacterium]|nr:prepilin-type N-terminal cleavage/methylation domain-containing protein [Thermodesulfobacteriota bacterium]
MCRKYHGQPITEGGFTMVELLIAMTMSAILIALIASSYWTQTRANRDQQLVLDMQQNLRSAMFYMQRDVMMAGYDADVDDSSVTPTITTAMADTITFTYNTNDPGNDRIDNDNDGNVDESDEQWASDGEDNDNDGTTDESDEEGVMTIQYSLYDSSADDDSLNDDLQREAGGQAIAGNIDNLEFFYTLADGSQTTGGTTGIGNPSSIRAIGISILARTNNEIKSSRPQVYEPLSHSLEATQWVYNDGFTRQMMKATVKCRNM